jgi:hypothetical protein
VSIVSVTNRRYVAFVAPQKDTHGKGHRAHDVHRARLRPATVPRRAEGQTRGGRGKKKLADNLSASLVDGSSHAFVSGHAYGWQGFAECAYRDKSMVPDTFATCAALEKGMVLGILSVLSV